MYSYKKRERTLQRADNSYLEIMGILVFQVCSKKFPHTGRLETTEMYSLTVLEAWCWKVSGRATPPGKALGRLFPGVL